MRDSRSKIPSKKSSQYIYDVKFLALLGAPYIYKISRLMIKGIDLCGVSAGIAVLLIYSRYWVRIEVAQQAAD
jgi:hypothetical protein